MLQLRGKVIDFLFMSGSAILSAITSITSQKIKRKRQIYTYRGAKFFFKNWFLKIEKVWECPLS